MCIIENRYIYIGDIHRSLYREESLIIIYQNWYDWIDNWIFIKNNFMEESKERNIQE